MNFTQISGNEFMVPGFGETINITEWRNGYLMDTVDVAAAIAAGATYPIFQNSNQKEDVDQFGVTNGQLSNKVTVIADRIGVMLRQARGAAVATDADLILVSNSGRVKFSLDDRTPILTRPIWALPAGFGVAGSTTRNATGVVTNGSPAQAAVQELLVPQHMHSGATLKGDLQFNNNAWIAGGSSMPTLSAPVLVTVIVTGIERYNG